MVCFRCLHRYFSSSLRTPVVKKKEEKKEKKEDATKEFVVEEEDVLELPSIPEEPYSSRYKTAEEAINFAVYNRTEYPTSSTASGLSTSTAPTFVPRLGLGELQAERKTSSSAASGPIERKTSDRRARRDDTQALTEPKPRATNLRSRQDRGDEDC